MTAANQPLKAWQGIHDGLAGMIAAEVKINADPDGIWEPDFSDSASQAMDGFRALMDHPDAVAKLLAALVADGAA